MESFSSTPGSSKRARTPTWGSQVASCLVDGCNSDLSKCRDYHRRHKVCELHSKTPKVMIGGQEQRFCQQCSRFHSLGEFDEGKRSCRKRLEGHNRRRRKPQPDSLPVKPATFLSTGRGSRFLPPFSSSPTIPASSVVTSTWSGAVKAENNPAVYNAHSELRGSSYSHPYRGRQFPFLQGSGSALSLPGSSGSNHPNDFGHGHDSALSLLSSSPAGGPEIGVVQPNPSPNLVVGLHYNGIGQIPGSLTQLRGSDFASNSTGPDHCQDVFHAALDGSSSANNGPQQTVSFLWE